MGARHFTTQSTVAQTLSTHSARGCGQSAGALWLIVLLSLFSPACVSSTPSAPAVQNKAALEKAFGEANAAAPPEIAEFGRFAGRWKCGVNERRADGSWRVRPDNIIWTFFYTLNGMAVQDIWSPEDQSQVSEGIATNLRLYNPSTQTWNSSWTNTVQASFELWSGGSINDEIVMTSIREQRQVKIRFFNILKQQFQWSYEAATSTAGTEFAPVMQLLCQRLE